MFHHFFFFFLPSFLPLLFFLIFFFDLLFFLSFPLLLDYFKSIFFGFLLLFHKLFIFLHFAFIQLKCLKPRLMMIVFHFTYLFIYVLEFLMNLRLLLSEHTYLLRLLLFVSERFHFVMLRYLEALFQDVVEDIGLSDWYCFQKIGFKVRRLLVHFSL